MNIKWCFDIINTKSTKKMSKMALQSHIGHIAFDETKL